MSNIADQENQQGGLRVASEARSERFHHGLRVYTEMTANVYGGGLNPALADLEHDFPFLVDAAMSFAIGEVWDRPQLAAKSRELAMIAALAALGSDGYPQLRLHVQYALNFGATPAELREIVYLTLVTAGVPKALNVAPEVRAVVGNLPRDRATAVLELPSSRRARGKETLSSPNGDVATDVSSGAALGPLLSDFPLLANAALSFAFGDVWSRAILDPVDRELAAVAAFAAIGADAWPQMRRHASYALRLGASADAIKETLAITIVSAGLPKALNAAAELRSILASQEGDHDA